MPPLAVVVFAPPPAGAEEPFVFVAAKLPAAPPAVCVEWLLSAFSSQPNTKRPNHDAALKQK